MARNLTKNLLSTDLNSNWLLGKASSKDFMVSLILQFGYKADTSIDPIVSWVPWILGILLLLVGGILLSRVELLRLWIAFSTSSVDNTSVECVSCRPSLTNLISLARMFAKGAFGPTFPLQRGLRGGPVVLSYL